MTPLRQMVAILAANLNAAVFVVGLLLFYIGTAGSWSWPIANVLTGLVLMVVAVWPFVSVARSSESRNQR